MLENFGDGLLATLGLRYTTVLLLHGLVFFKVVLEDGGLLLYLTQFD